jgi:putative LysE/RhtB family amino acid efflux pump
VSPRAALRTGLVATASNPLTIASWAAVFGAASAAGDGAAAAAPLLVLGVGVGSLAWHALLVAAMRVLRRRVGDRTLRAVDAFSGGALVLGGGALGVRAFRKA